MLSKFWEMVVNSLFLSVYSQMSFKGRVGITAYRAALGEGYRSLLIIIGYAAIFVLIYKGLTWIGAHFVADILFGVFIAAAVCWNLAIALFSFRLMFMRWHDFNHSAWWIPLIYLGIGIIDGGLGQHLLWGIPLAGLSWGALLFFKEKNDLEEENDYGKQQDIAFETPEIQKNRTLWGWGGFLLFVVVSLMAPFFNILFL